MAAKTFKTTIFRDGPMCFIPVSFDPRAVFGKVRAPVKVTLNRYSYRSTISSMGGTVCVPLRKSNREAAGLDGTETLTVKLELDTDKRDVAPPADLVKALKEDRALWDRWRELSFTHRREYAEAIEGAKKPETRARRIEGTVRALAARPPKKADGPGKARGSKTAKSARKASGGAGEAFVALLRGINVGGKNILSMKDLAAMFEKAGCREVVTYIQSGNVVFRADPKAASRISDVISKAILAKSGLRIPVVVRTASDLRRVTSSNPFIERGVDTEKLHLVFLADRPAASQAALLDPGRSPPDEFVLRGAEIYLHCPDGVGRSKLTNAYFDAKLGTVSTGRNWRTVLKLLELAGG